MVSRRLIIVFTLWEIVLIILAKNLKKKSKFLGSSAIIQKIPTFSYFLANISSFYAKTTELSSLTSGNRTKRKIIIFNNFATSEIAFPNPASLYNVNIDLQLWSWFQSRCESRESEGID